MFVESNFKVRNHCHITERYRGAAHRDCDIKVSLNYRIPIGLHILKLGKLDFKISVTPNGLEI